MVQELTNHKLSNQGTVAQHTEEMVWFLRTKLFQEQGLQSENVIGQKLK